MSEWRIRLSPVITPLLRTWWRWRRPTTLGVRVLCKDGEGRVLLVRHGYANGWHLPGGGVERGETAAEAGVRELAEEGGAEAQRPPRLIGFYANHANFPNDHIALYAIDAWRPCPPRDGREIAERGWFAPDAPPNGTTPGTLRRLAEIFDGAPQSATW
jgi:8-oxo-dGTP pyrophosphatase MutT (NUDIX family)